MGWKKKPGIEIGVDPLYETDQILNLADRSFFPRRITTIFKYCTFQSLILKISKDR